MSKPVHLPLPTELWVQSAGITCHLRREPGSCRMAVEVCRDVCQSSGKHLAHSRRSVWAILTILPNGRLVGAGILNPSVLHLGRELDLPPVSTWLRKQKETQVPACPRCPRTQSDAQGGCSAPPSAPGRWLEFAEKRLSHALPMEPSPSASQVSEQPCGVVTCAPS